MNQFAYPSQLLPSSMRPSLLFSVTSILLISFVSLSVAPSSAHEERQVGPYKLEIGWRDEPTLTGEKNAVFLSVNDTRTNLLVAGLEGNLTATLIFGSSTFKPTLGSGEQPGEYLADLIPTRPGTYNATISGVIGSLQVNENFELDRVTNRSDIEFPSKDPSPSSLQDSISNTDSRAGLANILGWTGVVVGAVGILIGAIAYMRKPRPPS